MASPSKASILLIITAILFFITIGIYGLMILVATAYLALAIHCVNNPPQCPLMYEYYLSQLPLYFVFTVVVILIPILLLMSGILLILWRNVAERRTGIRILGVLTIILGVLYLVVSYFRRINLFAPLTIPMYVLPILGGILSLIAASLIE